MVTFTAEDAHVLGSEIASKKPGSKLNDRTFIAFYGRNSAEVAEIWDSCNERVQPKAQPKHLMWTLMYMKLYNSMDVMCILLDTSKPTFEKWVWSWIGAIATKHADVVSKDSVPPTATTTSSTLTLSIY
jgi:hypothetical protein